MSDAATIVVYDGNPVQHRYCGGDVPEPEYNDYMYPGVPTPVQDAVVALAVDQFDEGRCGVAGCTQPVGASLAEDHNERPYEAWAFTVAVYDGRQVTFICEDHALEAHGQEAIYG